MHPNEEVIRKLYDARARGDDETVRALLAPDVYWYDPYPPPFGGEFHGVEALFAGLFRAIATDLDAAGLELHDIVANDEHAVALVHWWSVRGGKRIDGREIGVYHVRDGRVTHVWFMTEDVEAARTFFS